MFLLIKEANVYAPQPLGIKDILIAGSQIVCVGNSGEFSFSGIKPQELNASGNIVIPGFIDPHVHILGGGGEGGPATRAPEIRIEDIIESGVTTLIGCLGTDGTTRHLESLLAKARALEIEGISTFIFSGSYELPLITFTGNIRRDLILIDKVIGAGEVAISDHRSSQPTFEELARLVADCRVGGLLAGKAGILHCHIGDGPAKLELLFRLIRETEIPSTQIIPTHVNRNKALLEEAFQFIKEGGFIDITATQQLEEGSHLSVSQVIRAARENNIPLERIMISSDSNGSLPVFDKKGELKGLTIATQQTLLDNFKYLVKKELLTLEEAIRLFSTNAAQFYRFSQKGQIATGSAADLLIFDSHLHLQQVISQGKIALDDGICLIKSTISRPRQA
ncbi:beta-aspartyl-peptidase [Candidatus Aminicenantes bacterium AC-334-K16]|jgi:beta-aspartyl-dipeptidase (metallo-type)|nr:beta-aspartyl-peptidase [Candidatus Aminicenantes bacterium AC-334-K16]